MRVVVAMSGGVDSSVAAGLMVEAGHEVIGMTMKLRNASERERAGAGGSCCSPDDLLDARAVCDTLGIPHYIVDYRALFKEQVIDPFAASYLRGETPNPCVRCNDHVKFAPLLERAQALGADRLVTGHYARIQEGPGGARLARALDPEKDQSYFLFGLGEEALRQSLFPLGELKKEEVRERARALGLPNWDKADSEDICFVPDGDYRKVVERVAGAERVPGPGPIVHLDGRVLGQHEGLHRYTVGQRRGLQVATGERIYVVALDRTRDILVVGPSDALRVEGFALVDCRWPSGEAPQGPRTVTARYRHRHQGAAALLSPERDGRATLSFDEAQGATAPGQSVVFYEGDVVIGGGTVGSVLRGEEVETPLNAILEGTELLSVSR